MTAASAGRVGVYGGWEGGGWEEVRGDEMLDGRGEGVDEDMGSGCVGWGLTEKWELWGLRWRERKIEVWG